MLSLRPDRRAWTVFGLALVAAAVLAAVTVRTRHSSPPSPRLLLLITVDTLRADHLGAYGAGRGRSPHLDKLAAQSVVFENAFAPAPFTLASVSALMSSRYPEEVGVTSNTSALAGGVETLASYLAERGWRTGAVVSNVALRAKSGIGAGFQKYDIHLPQREAVRRHPERTGRPTTRAALSMLKELGGFAGDRVFLWVHYQDPHGPYTPPAPYDARFTEEPGPLLELNRDESGLGGIPHYQDLGRRDAGFYRARYKGEVAYLDDSVGWLLSDLAERGVLEDAIVVFTADHGEAMGEDGYWFAHGERVTDPLVHVPLFVRARGRTPGRRADVVSLLDVFPTVTSLLGGPAAPAGGRGRPLFARNAAADASTVYQSTLGMAPVPHRALVSRGYRYVAEDHPGGVRERVAPLAGQPSPRPEMLATLRGEMERLRGTLKPPREGRVQDLTPEELESLRALGYVDTR
jgi:arylsulfatase A-like enzyme